MSRTTLAKSLARTTATAAAVLAAGWLAAGLTTPAYASTDTVQATGHSSSRSCDIDLLDLCRIGKA